MKKIYTSINNADLFAGLDSPTFEINYVQEKKPIENMEEYDLVVLMISSDSNLPALEPVDTDVFVLDENGLLKQVPTHIKVLPDMSALKKAILLWTLTNKSIKRLKEGSPKPKQTKNETAAVLQTDNKITGNKPLQKEVDPFNKENDKDKDKDKKSPTDDDIVGNEIEEVNSAPPILIEADYPSKEMPAEYEEAKNKVNIMRNSYVFKGKAYPNNQTIGIWSPLSRIGVTTFIINYAIFLQANKIQTAVIEGIKGKYLQHIIERYEEKPSNYKSFMEVFHLEDKAIQNMDISQIHWYYKGVLWLPIGDKDKDYIWDESFLNVYFQFFRYHDVVLVDLPNGEMQQETLASLQHMDELWIVIDNSIDILLWKSYIQSIQKDFNKPIKLLFNRKMTFSKPEDVARELDLPLITTIPDLTEEHYNNQFENHALIENTAVFNKLLDPFRVITKELGVEIPPSRKLMMMNYLRKLIPLKG
ncbi:hypothetical protein WKH57_25215 [Niallia taxi]|uniref:hypothetical protein n=1 Tax=Niallia taxi TaxID=2499688 RepID=UPI00316CD918